MLQAVKVSLLPSAPPLLGLVLSVASCTTFQDDLLRAQHAYKENRTADALALLRADELELDRLSPEERTRYAYLRGMTDFRVGYREDARHWLSLATAWESAAPGGLPVEWKGRLGETLTELNEIVWKSGGVAALHNEATSTADESEEPPLPKKGDKTPAAKSDAKKASSPKRPSQKPAEAAPKPAASDSEGE